MITIPDEYFEVESCVYKLYYGDRYVIVKGKTLSGSVYLIERGYAAMLTAGGGTGWGRGGQGQKEWDGVNTYYFKFYSFIQKHPGLQFKIELLLESTNHYDLLKTEQLALNESIKDSKCLNSNLTSYIPIYRKKTRMYGWINKGSVLAFKKFLAS